MTENIKKINIETEMQEAYLDYAMSVIISRALPDVRDGLKPVHRRILYTMHEMKLFYDKPFKKSARIIGDVMGKYHPHGDASIYNALVRMAQPFSLRYMLVDGQGNFGSVDGDSAAAMRYSEARMQKMASELLKDIDKETVDFIPNYDNTLKEPSVLPSLIPNLLVNGTEGIAVAMATKIPPHNLTEILTALITMIDNPKTTVDDLLEIVKGPDFPTSAFIYGNQGIKEAYRTGKGKVVIRAKVKLEVQSRSKRESIIITEIPYQVVKAKLVQDIAKLVRDKVITDIDDIRDESGRKGMRIVISLKRNANSGIIINKLYKKTKLQIAYHINMLALHHGQPKVMTLIDILKAFLDHRRDVVTRRTIFLLNKAQARMHILKGYEIALANIDEVIRIIRASKTRIDARDQLMSNFLLSEIQADAVLELRLHRLTSMEVDKIKEEIRELQEMIDYYNLLLSNDVEMMNLIKSELVRVKADYGDERRSQLVPDEGEISIEDLIIDEDMAVTISHQNYIKRVPISTYRKQRRGGKGKKAMGTKDEDFVERLFVASNHDDLLFFTNKGKVYRKKVYELPEASRTAKGRPVVNVLPLESDEILETVLAIREYTDEKYILMCTQNGKMKKTKLTEFSRINANGKIAIKINDDDKLKKCSISDGTNDVFIISKDGKAVRFPESQIRAMGRTAAGVRGMKLRKDDKIVNMILIESNTDILVVSENGYGKKTSLSEYKSKNRGIQGVMAMQVTEKTGKLVSALQVQEDNHLVIITDHGKLIRIATKNINTIGRNTQGVKLINVNADETVVAAAKLIERKDDDEIQEPVETVEDYNEEKVEEETSETSEISETSEALDENPID